MMSSRYHTRHTVFIPRLTNQHYTQGIWGGRITWIYTHLRGVCDNLYLFRASPVQYLRLQRVVVTNGFGVTLSVLSVRLELLQFRYNIPHNTRMVIWSGIVIYHTFASYHRLQGLLMSWGLLVLWFLLLRYELTTCGHHHLHLPLGIRIITSS